MNRAGRNLKPSPFYVPNLAPRNFRNPMAISFPTYFKNSAQLSSWGRIITQFLVGHLGVALVGSLTGFLLLRWMPKADFARYSLTFSIQTLIASLTDAGFTGAIVALVGERADDPEVVGRYIRAVVWFRTRLFAIMAIASFIIVPFLCAGHDWTMIEQANIIGAVLLTTAARGWSVFGSVLVINKRMKDIYQPQGFFGLVRLGLTGTLHLIGQLGGTASIWISSLAEACFNYAQYRSGRKLVVLPEESDVAVRSEVLRYVAPLSFGILYGAVQGQLVTFITSRYGTTNDLADISALSRLFAIFNIMTLFTWYILEPYCARQSLDVFRKRYPLVVAGMFTPLALAVVLAYLWAEPFLFIMGNTYSTLRPEIPLAITTLAIGQFSGAVGIINSARRLVFWWYTIATIVVTLSIQLVCLQMLNMKHIHDVLLFSFYTGVATLLLNMSVGVYHLYFKGIPVLEKAGDEMTQER